MLPDEIIQRFRVVSLDRLDKLEAAWCELMAAPDDPAPAAIVQREAHTLKGDSRMVGFHDVNLVCHKLEDLFALARERGYRVGEDFDLAVTMAVRFIAILLRKRVGTELGGIDLPGFVAQIDGVIAETRRQLAPPSEEPALARAVARKDEMSALRRCIARPTIDIFIEGLRGDRPRLRQAWATLRQLVVPAPPERIALAFEKHEMGASALAVELGKQVTVEFELADLEVTADVIGVLDLAVLHLVRNALDHGIEPPAARVAAGKNPTGRIAVRLLDRGDALELVVTDDGRGIDFARVRASAIAQGLLDPAAEAGTDVLSALLFRPGFSTRAVATDVSGRGVGLDAVSAAIIAAGGAIAVTSDPGEGTRWTALVPAPPTRVAANVFRAPGADTLFAVDAGWAVEVVSAVGALDCLIALGIGEPARATAGAVGLRFRRGSISVVLLAAAPPVAASAENLITAAGTPASIALIDGVEGLLIHPEALAA